MKCLLCHKENEEIEVKGVRGIICCNEFHVDFDSLRPKVKGAIIEDNRFWRKLENEINKYPPNGNPQQIE